jgi:hypothetical protein
LGVTFFLQNWDNFNLETGSEEKTWGHIHKAARFRHLAALTISGNVNGDCTVSATSADFSYGDRNVVFNVITLQGLDIPWRGRQVEQARQHNCTQNDRLVFYEEHPNLRQGIVRDSQIAGRTKAPPKPSFLL